MPDVPQGCICQDSAPQDVNYKYSSTVCQWILVISVILIEKLARIWVKKAWKWRDLAVGRRIDTRGISRSSLSACAGQQEILIFIQRNAYKCPFDVWERIGPCPSRICCHQCRRNEPASIEPRYLINARKNDCRHLNRHTCARNEDSHCCRCVLKSGRKSSLKTWKLNKSASVELFLRCPHRIENHETHEHEKTTQIFLKPDDRIHNRWKQYWRPYLYLPIHNSPWAQRNQHKRTNKNWLPALCNLQMILR